MKSIPQFQVPYIKPDGTLTPQGVIFQELGRAVETLNSTVAVTDGWEVHNHGGGAQTLVANTEAVVTIDGATGITGYQPPGTSLFADHKITGREGDAIVVKFQCVFTPTTAEASAIQFSVDIGGAVGVVEYQDFALVKGAGMAHRLSWTFLAYTLNTWEANGGELKAVVDGPGDLTEKRTLVARISRA